MVRGLWRSGARAGRSRGNLSREWFGHRPTRLLVGVRCYKCAGCGGSWCEDLRTVALERAKLSGRGVRWALGALVIDHFTVTGVAAGLGVG